MGSRLALLLTTGKLMFWGASTFGIRVISKMPLSHRNEKLLPLAFSIVVVCHNLEIAIIRTY